MKSSQLEDKILYTEQQSFRQKFLWISLIILDFLSVFCLFDQIVFKWDLTFGIISVYDIFPIIATMSFVTILFFIFRLETVITTSAIGYRFFPIHHKFRFIDKNDMTKITVRKYKALREFGGWGIRVGFYGNSKAFNISGDTGLQIELKNGKRILIGTNNEEKLKEALRVF